MVLRARALLPVVEALGIFNWEIVDARVAVMHYALRVVFPIFVAVGAKPLAGIVVPLVGEADGDARFVESPELFDEAVIEFAVPFAREELNDLVAAVDEFRAVAPVAIDGVCERRVEGRVSSMRLRLCALSARRFRE